jgi:hypothetical protein
MGNVMNQEQLLQLLSDKRREYAESWAKTAAHGDANGSYEWMASFLDGYRKVLEIGVGDGVSTLRLLEKGHSVVGIDSNIQCLERAQNRLGQPENARLIRRERWDTSESGLVVRYSSIAESLDGDNVIFVEGDIVNDPELERWLASLAPFDAVACWLIGTNAVDLVRHGGQANVYRCKVQNRVYELAESLLRSQGIVHIVDRAELPTEETQDRIISTTLEAHRDQASVTSLVVDSSAVAHRPWDDPEDGIGMIRSGIGSTESGLALVSTIARKP